MRFGTIVVEEEQLDVAKELACGCFTMKEMKEVLSHSEIPKRAVEAAAYRLVSRLRKQNKIKSENGVWIPTSDI